MERPLPMVLDGNKPYCNVVGQPFTKNNSLSLVTITMMPKQTCQRQIAIESHDLKLPELTYNPKLN